MKFATSLALSAVLALSAAPVLAQSSGNMQNMQKQQNSMAGMPGMDNMPSHGMLGSHMMPATVLSVDANTGITEVDTGGMKLRLHFPPASLATVKAGDKIQLHMAFTK
jgi:hypothetical protein